MLSIPKSLEEKIYSAARVYLWCSNVTWKSEVSAYEFAGSNSRHNIWHMIRFDWIKLLDERGYEIEPRVPYDEPHLKNYKNEYHNS
jgi:hypothetical protein